MRIWIDLKTSCLLSSLVPFLIGLGLGDSLLVTLFLLSLALFFSVINAFFVFSFCFFSFMYFCFAGAFLHLAVFWIYYFLPIKKKKVQLVKPHVRDQSNKVWSSKDFNWSIDLSISSTMRLFHSFHTNHITHVDTRFYTFKECLPNQFQQPKRKDATLSGNTQWIPKILNTSLHKAWANSQWIKRWVTTLTLYLRGGKGIE